MHVLHYVLHSYLLNVHRLTPLDRTRILKEAWEGVHWLHSARENDRRAVVHSDLKPANILLDDDVRGKIADVGLAFRVALTSQQTHTSRPSQAFFGGTPGYQDPRATDPRHPRKGEKNDVFSFGVILFELFSVCEARPGVEEGVRRDMLALAAECVDEVSAGGPPRGLCIRAYASILQTQ
jgi:serine/threonine protein kinase